MQTGLNDCKAGLEPDSSDDIRESGTGILKKRMEIHYNHVMHKQLSTPENFTHNSGAALYIFFRGLSNTPDSWLDTILEATQQRASPPENLRQQDKIW